MTRHALLEARDSLVTFPAAPDSLHRIRQSLEDPKTSLETISDLIIGDEGLHSGLIGLQRVPFFGTVSALPGLGETLRVLGREKVGWAVGILAAFQTLRPRDAIGQDLADALWTRSSRVAATAVKIAVGLAMRDLGGVARVRSLDRLYAAGLLHDVGWLVLAARDSLACQQIDAETKLGGTDRRELERAHFGFAHDEIGGAFCLQWSFDREFVLAVRDHHRPERQDLAMLDHLHLGEVVVRRQSGDPEKPSAPAMTRRRLTLDELDRFAEMPG
ncbi:MAG: HDOD domain-containing protein, partial [Planctomycetes bacterium]|nr:HDOD domain-containing protein [Planctomycetota bacterium]